MAKAKKLPSGNWRVQAKKTVDGKVIVKSFTDKTQIGAEKQARDWQRHIDTMGNDTTSLTVEQAVTEYINIKSNVLSCSTISGYKRHLKNGFPDLKSLPLYKLNNVLIQRSVNNASKTYSAKTIKNYYGLLFSALKMFYPELTVSVTLPASMPKIKKDFSKKYISDIIKAIEDTPIEIPALLAMTLSCRASEVAGLKWSDVNFGKHTITIQRAKLYTENGYVIQERTKNSTSTRTVYIPDILYQKLVLIKSNAKSDFITDIPSEQYSKRLNKALAAANVEGLTFHDLRHITASVMLVLGIDTQTAQKIGGWATDNIMKSVYQHTFTESRQQANQSINSYFTSLGHTKCHTNSKKRFKIKRFVAI